MKNTGKKKEYRRLLAILQKGEGRTYEDIANEHGVSSRSVHTDMGYCLYPKWR
jgi:DNA-directed RNA polymerase specialized sigma24 family protein